MATMIHLTTHRLVKIYYLATGAKNMGGIAKIVRRILVSRGLDPWELEKQYYYWNDRNWLYKTFLFFLKPEFMKDDNVLSPEAIEIERKFNK